MSRGIFAALSPSDCRLCAAPLQNISRLPVCEECIAAIQPIVTETCGVCGEALPALSGGGAARGLCSACQETPSLFAKAVAFGAYDEQLRELIHLLKYEKIIPAAGVLGKYLLQAIQKLDSPPKVLIVPVPLHSSKRRQRRFNQAELIARAALKRMGGDRAQFASDVLKRVRPTVSQIGLTRPQRRDNIRGAFQVVHLNRVEGRSILLVDDVLTTGTTASECARVLRKAGADQVWVATVARTLKIAGRAFEDDRQFEQQAS